MKAIIIDDETKARKLLQLILKDKCQFITKIYNAPDLLTGIELIKKRQPDIVFLDINMPVLSGLKILDFFKNEEVNFQVIFTTAHECYALEAFKISAVDYLLKPLIADEISEAVQKAIVIQKKEKVYSKLDDLRRTFQQLALNKIALEVPKGIAFVSFDEILYFEADGMYTKVYLDDERVELICKPLIYFTKQLEDNQYFFRPHRSYFINLKHVKQLIKKDGTYLLMKNDKILPISKDKQREFIRIIQSKF